jgi:hypothetical protein
MSYYIFEDWTSIYDSIFDSSGSDCSDATGGYTWDPTVSCYNMSGNANCQGNTICGAESGTDVYSCDYDNDPYSCAPGDLAGKWGTFMVSDWNDDDTIISGSGWDQTAPSLYNIMGRSVGIVCEDKIVACGRFKDVSVATATATFSSVDANSNIDGSVTIENNKIVIDLDLFSETGVSTACIGDGLKYHIHEKWTHSDDEARVGGSLCNSTFTGGHFDPYAACGSATGNDYCSDCSVPASSYVDEYSGTYTCNTVDFGANPFVCEVGDLSGKYGTLSPDSNDLISGEFSSQYAELRGTDLSGKSIVFHCNDGSRIFCAPFSVEGTDGMDVLANDAEEDTDLDDNDAHYVDFSSVFGDNNYINIWSNGRYLVSFDIDSSDIDCTSSWMTYSLYHYDGTNKVSNCGSNDLGNFFDPGYKCPEEFSVADECDCIQEESGFEYNCDFDNDRYSCAAGDLGGKWGLIKIGERVIYTGYDYTLPPSTDISELGIAVECISSNSAAYTLQACGPLKKGVYDEDYGILTNYNFIIVAFISLIGILYA